MLPSPDIQFTGSHDERKILPPKPPIKTHHLSTPQNASYEDMGGANYDALFDNVDILTRLEAKSLDGVLKGNGVRTVLDCAAGTGLQAIGLARLGYDVSASDISKAMVEELHRKATSHKLHIVTKTADFTNLSTWRGKQFDAVINCGHSILYVENLDQVTQTLKAMQSVAKDNGLIVLSVHNYSKLKAEGKDFQLRKGREINGHPEWILDTRTFTDETVTNTHIFTGKENGHYYSREYPKTSLLVKPDELQICMEKSGLTSVRLLDLVTLKPFTDGEWILAVGYKPKLT